MLAFSAKYKEALNEFKKGIRSENGRIWRDFCDQIERKSNASRLKKLMASKSKNQPAQISKEYETYAKDSEVALKPLLEKHFQQDYLEVCLCSTVEMDRELRGRGDNVPNLITKSRIGGP